MKSLRLGGSSRVSIENSEKFSAERARGDVGFFCARQLVRLC